MRWEIGRSINPLIIPLIMPLIFLTCCERDQVPFGIEIGSLTYTREARFLGAKELSVLKTVSDNKLVFNSQVGSLGNIRKNNILVLGVSEHTPYGLMRKVTGIQKNGNDLEIGTADATLTDAVKKGTIILSKKFVEKDFYLMSKAEGVIALEPGKSFDGLAVTLENFEISKDGASSLRVAGSIGVSPEISITIIIESSTVKSIISQVKFTKIDELSFTSSGAYNGQKEIILGEFVHIPVVIDSLVFVPVVTFKCGVSGSINSSGSSGVRQDRIIVSGQKYENNNWSASLDCKTDNYDFISPALNENSDLLIYSGPELNIQLFGMSIQTVNSNGFFKLKADKTLTPWWKLSIGNEGSDIFKAAMFDLGKDYSSGMNVLPSEIAAATGAFGSKSSH